MDKLLSTRSKDSLETIQTKRSVLQDLPVSSTTGVDEWHASPPLGAEVPPLQVPVAGTRIGVKLADGSSRCFGVFAAATVDLF